MAHGLYPLCFYSWARVMASLGLLFIQMYKHGSFCFLPPHLCTSFAFVKGSLLWRSLLSSFEDCGSCAYPLNLSSSNRITSNIGLKYCKAIKKGVISFMSIDESRFTQVDEVKCLPYFVSRYSWGLFRSRTKLLCRKCGMFIGHGYEDGRVSCGSDSSDSSYGSGTTGSRKYNVNIRALQPSDETDVSFLL